jgi:hypothetical protein
MRHQIVCGLAIASLLSVAAVACGSKQGSDFSESSAGDGGSGNAPLGDGGSTGPLSGGDGGATTGDGAAPAGEVFGHSSDTLYKLDPTTNTVKTIGKFSGIDTSCDANEGMWDIALDKDGNMYGTVETEGSDCSTTGGEIVKIDPTTAATTVLGTSSTVFPNSLSFVPAGTIDPTNEVLVGYNGATYVRIDPTSGNVTTIGSLNPNSTGSSWYSSGDIVSVIGGKTYLTATTDPTNAGLTNDSIIEVDPVTGKALTVIGEVGFPKVWGLGFWGGTAYGFDEGGDLFSIDLTNGASTRIPLTGIGSVSFFGAGNTTAAPLTQPR